MADFERKRWPSIGTAGKWKSEIQMSSPTLRMMR